MRKEQTHVGAADVVKWREVRDCTVAVHDVRHQGASGSHQPYGRLPSNKDATADTRCTISKRLTPLTSKQSVQGDGSTSLLKTLSARGRGSGQGSASNQEVATAALTGREPELQTSVSLAEAQTALSPDEGVCAINKIVKGLDASWP